MILYSVHHQKNNYAKWRDDMKSQLVERNLWNVVLDEDEISFGDWEEKNSSALSLIRGSCGSEASSTIRDCTSASVAWEILGNRFGPLEEDNFEDWAVRTKSYFIAQNLWGAIDYWHEDKSYYDQLAKEEQSLQKIRDFCGEDAKLVIKDENKPDRAWEKLEEKYGVTFGIKPDGENYEDWSSWMEYNLRFLQFWDIIGSSTDPTVPENDEVASETWREKNSGALEVIRIFCGWRALFTIKDTSLAKTAWNTLEEVYKEPVKRFIKAVKSGAGKTIEKLSMHHPRLKLDKITDRGETATHVAVRAGNEQIVELLLEQTQSIDHLRTFDNQGYTALGQAIFRNKLQMVGRILRKKEELIKVEVEKERKRIPIVLAIENGNEEMARFLYGFTPLEVLMEEEGVHGATVCVHAIYNGMLDIALELIKKHQPLALAMDVDGRSPMYALASMPNLFPRVKRDMLFNHADQQIQSTSAGDETRLNVHGQTQSYESGFKDSFSLAGELLSYMRKQIPISSDEDMNIRGISSAVNLAIREGMYDFIVQIMENDAFKWIVDTEGRTTLANAVLHRQAKIFRHLLKNPEDSVMINSLDKKKNNILHMAGMVPPTQPDHIPGAAMQMQYELRWFKEVERLVYPSMRNALNEDTLTPRELFEKEHRDLRKEGEKWMKSTATSGTVVCALIVSIMFTALFQVPGGYNQETGLPVLLNEKSFKIFMFCNSISLVFSSTSALVFLEIISSRCAQEDFLASLPRKMIIGLSTLSLSIAATVIVFFATLSLSLRGQSSLFVPVICLVGLQAVLFVIPKYRFVIDFFRAGFDEI